MKTCSRCDQTKPLSEFHRTRAQADGHNRQCKECRRAYYRANRGHQIAKAKAWYAENRDRAIAVAHASNRRRLYGVSAEQFEAMMETQEGLCAICRQPSAKTLHVDHDHLTGCPRGLLCSRCNLGIGHFADSPALLEAAAAYLERGDEASKQTAGSDAGRLQATV